MTDTASTTDHWLDDLRNRSSARLTQVARVQDDLAGLQAEALAAEGRVRVRVNAAGRPTALTLDPRALSLPAPDLAAAILRAVDDASALAAARVAGLVGELMGPEEVDAMLSGIPSQGDRVAVRDELAGTTAG